jgi:hypothetical protein
MWRKYNSNKTSIRREQAVLVIQCATRQWLAVRQLISIWENMDYQHRVESAAITCQVSWIQMILHISCLYLINDTKKPIINIGIDKKENCSNGISQ